MKSNGYESGAGGALSPPPRCRLFVTGFGLVTPLGLGAWETFAALLAGRTISDRAAKLPAELDPVELVRAVGGVSVARYAAIDPSIDLAERAAREALAMAGVDGDDLPAIIGTSKGAIHALTAAARQLPTTTTHACGLALGPHGLLTHHLRHRLHLGPTTHLVAACASSLIALHRARLSLLHPPASPPLAASRRRPAILVLTSDAALLPMFIHAYRRLGVLAPPTIHEYKSFPLDNNRRGFTIAEAGAAVVLERFEENEAPPRRAVELIDTAEACDAYDLVRTCPGLPALGHLAQTLFSLHNIDLLHPHAPGTGGEPDHDATELAALLPPLTASRQSLPDLYANKGALGHTLGASGLVSLIIACLCALTQRRPPMPWLTNPIDSPFAPSSLPPGTPIRTQAIFAAGFAGHAAGAVIRL